MRVLLLANNIDNICGVSSHLFNLSLGLQESGLEFRIAYGGGDAVKKFRDAGFNLIRISLLSHENRSVRGYIKAHLSLISHLVSGCYDLIHSHHHYCANVAYNISKLTRIKTIQTNHGILPQYGRLNHFAADHFIVVNDHIYNYMISSEKILPERVTIIYNGGINHAPDDIGFKKKLRFIAAARFVKEKGLDDYIMAVNSLEDRYFEEAEFFLAGDGEYREELLKLNINRGGKVSFKGRVENLSEKFIAFDVCVICSRNEGLPMTMIESVLSNCMMITSDYPGLNKYFNPENGCLIYEQGNYEALAKIIAALIEYPEVLSANAEKMKAAAGKIFSYREMTERTIQTYYKILYGERRS